MKKALFALLLLLPFGIQSQNCSTENKQKSYNQVHGIFIGISDYEYLTDLQYASKDAHLIFDVFGKIYPDHRENFQLLLNNEASDENILKELAKLSDVANSGDLIIFSFTGHSDLVYEEKGYMLAQNATKDKAYNIGGAIEMDLVEKIFAKVQKKENIDIIFILDCATSGSGYSISNISFDIIKNTSQFNCCEKNEQSYEDSSLGHGIFTYYLAKGMLGAADGDMSRSISFDELNSYLKISVRNFTNNKQTPSIRSSNEYQEFLILNDEIIEFGKTLNREIEELDLINTNTK